MSVPEETAAAPYGLRPRPVAGGDAPPPTAPPPCHHTRTPVLRDLPIIRPQPPDPPADAARTTAAPQARAVVRFECPHCLRRLRATAAIVGRATACPTCDHALVVPPPPALVRLDDTQPSGYRPLPPTPPA